MANGRKNAKNVHCGLQKVKICDRMNAQEKVKPGQNFAPNVQNRQFMHPAQNRPRIFYGGFYDKHEQI